MKNGIVYIPENFKHDALKLALRDQDASGSKTAIRERLLARVRRNRFDGVAKYWLETVYTDKACSGKQS